jgi:hypothetical protein
LQRTKAERSKVGYARRTQDQGVEMTGATNVIFGETIEPSKPDPKPGR